jgi:hypothetical protein
VGRERGLVPVDLVQEYAVGLARGQAHVEAIAARLQGAGLLGVVQHQRHELGHDTGLHDEIDGDDVAFHRREA